LHSVQANYKDQGIVESVSAIAEAYMRAGAWMKGLTTTAIRLIPAKSRTTFPEYVTSLPDVNSLATLVSRGAEPPTLKVE